MDLLPISHIVIWKMLVSWDLQIFQMLNDFILQDHFLAITTDVIRKGLKCWEALKLWEWTQVFLNPNFYLKVWILSWVTNTVSYFPVGDRLTYSFWRKYLPGIQVWVTLVCVSVLFSSKHGVSWARGLVSSQPRWGPEACPQDVPAPCMVLCGIARFITHGIEMIRTQGWDLIKLIALTALWRAFLSAAG